MNIMIIGPDPDAQGGIATVIKNFKTAKTPEDVHFFFIEHGQKKENFVPSVEHF